MSIFGRKKHWITPDGRYYDLFADMAAQPHLMIAGATGSGKSVVERGIMHALLYSSPARVQFILIDPKKVELIDYINLPHVIRYAADPDDRIDALQQACRIMDARFTEMSKQGAKMYDGPDIYVLIDELADLMTTQKRGAAPLIQHIGQLGRAARVHLIVCTQCPLREIIPTSIACNIDARVALRTRNAQDSRNIMQRSGCELLPRYGRGYYMRPGELDLYNIPMIPPEEIARLVTWWTSPRRCTA